MIPNVKPSVLYESRCCNQDEFDVAVFGGRNKVGCANEFITISFPDLKTSVERSLIPPRRHLEKTVLIGSEVYIFDRVFNKGVCSSTFEMYSKKTKVFQKLKFMDKKRKLFSVCSFMNCVYLVGGYSSGCKHTAECYKYESKNDEWRQISSLHKERSRPSCSVFEGKIFVTGGYNGDCLKSVEALDYHENKWYILPDMIKCRRNHSSFTSDRKLFVVGGEHKRCSEVYDSISRKFAMFSKKLPFIPENENKTIGFNNKIVSLCECYCFPTCRSNCFDKLRVYSINKKRWIKKEIVLEYDLDAANLQKVPKQ